MMSDDISVVTGAIDSKTTYEQLHVESARMVFVNAEDTLNTNIILTVREVNPSVPVVALADHEDSIDILELSGATHVLQLKQRLGEQLASRISAGAGSAHIVGRFKDLRIAEFVVHETDLAGRTLAESRLRELTGVNVVGLWEKGQLKPISENTRFSRFTIPLAIGTEEQIGKLNRLIGVPDPGVTPVLIIGAGRVGRAAAAAMELRGVPVHMVEKNGALAKDLADVVEQFVVGNAADRDVLLEAGLEDASAVALTTNDDAVNVYLTIYCRRLKPEINIVSRITHERNVEAIYRAGADSVLSYSSLGREYVVSRLFDRDPIMVGEGADFFFVDTPRSLAGKTLAGSDVGARTGLIIVAVEGSGEMSTNPAADTVLPASGRMLMIGTAEQRQLFAQHFEH
jgi:Trk K+ transport system NAD-binding subunit